MNLTILSNLFNIIVQATAGLNFYHFGYVSELNAQILNNYTKGAVNGTGSKPVLYPAVIFQPPDSNLDIIQAKDYINAVFYFCDLQSLDPASKSPTPLTIVEKQDALIDKVKDLLTNLYTTEDASPKVLEGRLVFNNPLNLEVLTGAYDDNLIVLKVTTNIKYSRKCEVTALDLTGLEALLPLEQTTQDLEKL